MNGEDYEQQIVDSIRAHRQRRTALHNKAVSVTAKIAEMNNDLISTFALDEVNKVHGQPESEETDRATG